MKIMILVILRINFQPLGSFSDRSLISHYILIFDVKHEYRGFIKFIEPRVSLGHPRFGHNLIFLSFCVGGVNSGSVSGLMRSGTFTWADGTDFNVNEQ